MIGHTGRPGERGDDYAPIKRAWPPVPTPLSDLALDQVMKMLLQRQAGRKDAEIQLTSHVIDLFNRIAWLEAKAAAVGVFPHEG